MRCVLHEKLPVGLSHNSTHHIALTPAKSLRNHDMGPGTILNEWCYCLQKSKYLFTEPEQQDGHARSGGLTDGFKTKSSDLIEPSDISVLNIRFFGSERNLCQGITPLLIPPHRSRRSRAIRGRVWQPGGLSYWCRCRRTSC